MNCDMINVFLYPVIINQDNAVFSKMLKEICAMTCKGSYLNNPLSPDRVRISKAWGAWNGKSSLTPPTAAVFCCASQRKLSCIRGDLSRACLSSVCERTHSDGLLGYLSSNYGAWFTKKKKEKKTVELLNIQQLRRPHLNKPTMQIFFCLLGKARFLSQQLNPYCHFHILATVTQNMCSNYCDGTIILVFSYQCTVNTPATAAPPE